jgi:hypothetical protein
MMGWLHMSQIKNLCRNELQKTRPIVVILERCRTRCVHFVTLRYPEHEGCNALVWLSLKKECVMDREHVGSSQTGSRMTATRLRHAKLWFASQ